MEWNLKKVDDLSRGRHARLTADDRVYYFGDYTPNRNYKFSDMNQFISNLKKSPLLRNRPEWRFRRCHMP